MSSGHGFCSEVSLPSGDSTSDISLQRWPINSGTGICYEVSLPSGDSNLALHLLIVQLHLLQSGGQPIQLTLHLLYLQCSIPDHTLHSFLCV